MTREIFKRDYDNSLIMEIDLRSANLRLGSNKIVDTLYLSSGSYLRVEEYEDGILYNSYCEVPEEDRTSLSAFRLWLDCNSVFYTEQMVQLIEEEEYELAGLILLSWLREEPSFNIDPSVSWVDLAKNNWDLLLDLLTANEWVGV